MTEVIVAARWGITTRDFLSVYLGRDGDVLANGQAKDVV